MGITAQELEVKWSSDTSPVDRAHDRVEKGSGRAARAFGAVGKAGALAFGTVGLGMAAAVGAGLKFAASQEQVRIGFTTMLGSAKAADSFMHQMADFAATSPFELPDVQAGARQLMAMGFAARDVIPMLTDVGDAVAAMGGGAEMIDRVTRALGQMTAKGVVSAEEMRQLAESGIPAWQMLADEIGVSIPEAMKMVQRREVESTTFMTAFHKGVADRFGGAMEKQSKTLLGLLSTFKDTVRMQLGDVASPLVASFTAVLPEVTKLVGGILSEIGPPFAEVLGTIAKALVGLLPVVAPLARAFSTVFGKVLEALEPVFPVFAQLAGVLGDILVALSPLLPPIGLLLAALGNVAVTILRALLPAVQAIVPPLAAFLTVTADVVNKVLVAFGPFLEEIASAMVDILMALLPLLPPLAQLLLALTPILVPLAELLALFVRFQVTVLTFVLVPLVKFLAFLVKMAATVIAWVANWKRWWDEAKAGFLRVWGAIMGFITGIPGRIVGAFSGAARWLVSSGQRVMSGLLEGARGFWRNISGWLSQLPSQFVRFFLNAGRWLFQAGRKIITGLWDGLKSVAGGMFKWVSGIGGLIGKLKGPLDADYRLLQPHGGLIMEGFLKGLQEGWKPVEAFVASRTMALSAGVPSPAYAVAGGAPSINSAAIARAVSAGVKDAIGGRGRTDLQSTVKVLMDGHELARAQVRQAILAGERD